MDYLILKEVPGTGFISADMKITVASAEEAQEKVEQLQTEHGGCYAAQYIQGT